MDKKLTTVDCLIMLQSAYPRLDLGPQTIKVYRLALADIEPPLLWAAVLKHISISKWLPTIAELREKVLELMLEADGQLGAPEAWGLVLREVRRVGHWGTPQIPAAAQQALEAIGGWRQLCMSENSTADRARFIEAYNLLCKREAERLQQLPAVTEMEEALAEGQEKGGKQLTVNSERKTVNGK